MKRIGDGSPGGCDILSKVAPGYRSEFDATATSAQCSLLRPFSGLL